MSDNTTLFLGTGGDTYRSIDKAGPKTQVVTLDVGGAGAESLVAGSVPISGTLAAVSAVTNLVNGTLAAVTNVGNLAGGTLGSVANVAAGTLNAVTSVGNVANGTLAAVTSVGNVVGGTVGVVTSVGNLVSGTLAAVTNLANGTLAAVTSVANIANGTLARITNLAGGTLGVVSSVANVAGGTININGTVPVSGSFSAVAAGTQTSLIIGTATVAAVAGAAQFTDKGTFTSGSNSVIMIGGRYGTGVSTLADGEVGYLRLTAQRALVVEGTFGATPVGTQTSFPVGGTVAEVTSVANLVGGTLARVSNIVGGTIGVVSSVGNVASGTLAAVTSVTNVASGTLAAVTSVTNVASGTLAAVTNLAGGTLGVVSSVSNVAAGTIGVVSSVSNVASGTLAAVTNLAGGTLGAVTSVTNIANGTLAAVSSVTNVAGGTIALGAMTAGGLSVYRSIDLDETSEIVKNGAGQVYGMWVANLSTAARFLKFYNSGTGTGTAWLATATPLITFPIPGNSTDYIAAVTMGDIGIAFSTGIDIAATTALADNSTGAPGANEVVVNIFYK